MLPAFYQAHLKSQLRPTEYLFLTCLVQLLQSLKQVSLETLATALPLPIIFESRRRKLQRFLKLPKLQFEQLWFPLLGQLIKVYFSPHEVLHIALDRTTWGTLNLLMVVVIINKRAIPIYGELLPQLGSSNLADQQKVLQPVLTLLKDYQLVVLGDREFCSVKLGSWLRQEKVYFCLRLKKGTYVGLENDNYTALKDLGLKPGMKFFLEGVLVTKQPGFGTFNVAAKWKKKVQGVVPDEAWFILTNLTTIESAIAAYRQRFDIEEMFRDWKLGGYHLEGTKLTGERFIGLVVLLTIAYSIATITGEKIKDMGVQKYVGRVKEAGRTERRHSSFYIGLYGQTWVHYGQYCWAAITELMRLNRNKRKYYRRGLRAMELILSAS
jgi:Transposase DDE domain